jgi:hypothetical protein
MEQQMRVIVRMSINNDYGSGLRNGLAPILEEGGLVRDANTATYEGSIDVVDLRDVMRRFWNTVTNYTGPAHIDHIWIYVDNKADAKDQADAEDAA